MTKERRDLHRLTPLLVKAGLPEKIHNEFFEGISTFTSMMAVLLKANEDVVDNYLTFALDTPEGENYELTIRKHGGKTPCDIINEKDELIERLRWNLGQWLPEKLGPVVAKIRGKKGRSAIRDLHPEIGPLLDDLDVAYQKWIKGDDD